MSRDAQQKIRPVLLAGGVGQRLWPLSREEMPKPFVPIPHMEHTLFQQAALRVADDTRFLPPAVVCLAVHRPLVTAQLERLGIAGYVMIEEDRPRNTAFAIARALNGLGEDGGATPYLICPTDHLIDAQEAFRRSATAALAALPADAVCLFGVAQAFDSTRDSPYGHIITGYETGDLAPVTRFVEKPSARQLAVWREKGVPSLINSGMVMARRDALLHGFATAAPQIMAGLDAPAESYPSFDVAVLQRLTRIYAARLPVSWADLGSWTQLLHTIPRDPAGNAAPAHVQVSEASNCIVFHRHRAFAERAPLEVAGVNNLVIIADDNALMVAQVAPEAIPQQGLVWRRYPATARFDSQFQTKWSAG